VLDRAQARPHRSFLAAFRKRIVRRPKAHLVTSLLVLTILAGCGSLVRYNWDESRNPAGVPSKVISDMPRWAANSVERDNSAVSRDLIAHDLRTPKASADLEQMARRSANWPISRWFKASPGRPANHWKRPG